MKSRGGFAMMTAGLGCRCGSSGFPSVTPHTAFRGKMGTWLWIIIEVFAKLEIHSSLIFFLSRQLSKFFRPLFFLISVQTPISYPLLSSVDHPQQFPFHDASVSAPGFLKHSSNLNMKSQSEQQLLPFLPHSFLTLNFSLTLLINIAASDPAGDTSTLQRQEWGGECNFANAFFSYKNLNSI